MESPDITHLLQAGWVLVARCRDRRLSRWRLLKLRSRRIPRWIHLGGPEAASAVRKGLVELRMALEGGLAVFAIPRAPPRRGWYRKA